MSDAEYLDLQQRLDEAKSHMRPFTGPYDAEWLLTGWNDPVWMTRNGKDTVLVDGKWVRTLNVNWHVKLADGTFLTDPEYADLLETLKRAAFLHREGFSSGGFPAPRSWVAFVNGLLAIARWLLFQRRYGTDLGLLDQSGSNQLAIELAKGGLSCAMQIPERIVDALHRETFGHGCPCDLLDDPGHLPAEVKDGITRFLQSRSLIITAKGHAGTVSRKYLSDLINEPIDSLTSPSERTRAVIRQFEPSVFSPTGLLLTDLKTGRKHPKHRAITVEEALVRPMTKSTPRRAAQTLRILLSMFRHLPDSIPDPCTLKPSTSYKLALPYCRDESHTPMIPVDTGLTYLNEAIRWVHCYGDDIVDYYCEVIRRINSDGEPENPGRHALGNIRGSAFFSTDVPASLASNAQLLEKFQCRKLERSRESMRVSVDAMQPLRVWIGAVVILIGMFKPSRASEVSSLPRGCLIGEGPYWLDSIIAKKGVGEHSVMSGGRPIPTITARGIQQMQRFGDNMKRLFDEKDPVLMNRLFYLPRGEGARKGYSPHFQGLTGYLDSFCDFVDLPLDSLGRRWYLRVHEMRKWFLLLMFWSGRFDVLDAVRDMAGHDAIEDLYAYIEREVSESDLGELEADYSIDRLRELDREREVLDGETGLEEMYRRVLDRFSVESLEMVSARSWENYVRTLRKSGEFHLEPYSIIDDSGCRHLCVAFRSTNRLRA